MPRTLRLTILTLICGLLAAQQVQQQQAPQPQPEDQPPTFRVGTEEVIAPVLVTTRHGDYVNGLRADQFRLFDNDKEQNIKVDVSFTPISLVILIQANANVEKILPQVQKIGNLITPIVIGDQGEAALIAYDSRIRTLQDFTNDPEKISEKVKKLYPGSTSNRMVDAVEQGIRMLRTRPKDRRRIMLMIGETRDLGSEARTRSVLMQLQVSNVAFYSVDMSRLVSTLTAPVQPGRPDPLPPAMRPLPPGVPATPTTVQQTYGTNGGRAEFIPLLVEIYRDVKAIFKANPVELFTKGTGGTEYNFYRQRGLEEAVQQIGEQLHSQYIVGYVPNNRQEGGFHEIKVEVIGHPEYRTQTRPGYWVPVESKK